MPTPAVTLRGQRTRNALLRAGRIVFERDGFLGARITDISAEARVAHGTFYTHFSTKEELFREVASILLPETSTVPRPIEYRGREQTIRGVSRATRRYLAAYQQNARLMGVVEQVATFDDGVRDLLTQRRKTYLARAESQIIMLQRLEIIAPELDPYTTAVALTAMVSQYAHSVYVGNSAVTRPIDFDASVRTLTWIWANTLGLGVDPHELVDLCRKPGQT